MFWSSFTRNLAAGIETVLMPAALRFHSSVGCKSSFRGITHNKEESKKKNLECREGSPVKENCRYCKPIPQLDSLIGKKKEENGAKEIPKQLHPKKDSLCETPVHESCAIAKFLLECCGNPCPLYSPRLDCLLYKPTDKAKRKYQQTWVNCPPLKIIPRRVCCYDTTELPPLYRRKETEKCKTCCEFDADKMKSFCAKNLRSTCSRITMPFCKIARNPPMCTYHKSPSCCKKYCCPYPAFSECGFSPCPRPTRHGECECLSSVAYCYAFRELKRKLIYNLPPALPAWPPKTS